MNEKTTLTLAPAADPFCCCRLCSVSLSPEDPAGFVNIEREEAVVLCLDCLKSSDLPSRMISCADGCEQEAVLLRMLASQLQVPTIGELKRAEAAGEAAKDVLQGSSDAAVEAFKRIMQEQAEYDDWRARRRAEREADLLTAFGGASA
jgi:hypothetical protein